MELDFQNLSVIGIYVLDYFPEYKPYLPSVYQLEKATLTELCMLEETPRDVSTEERESAFNRLKNKIELECLLHIPDIDHPSPDVVGLFDERNILLEKWRRVKRMSLTELFREYDSNFEFVNLVVQGYQVWYKYQLLKSHVSDIIPIVRFPVESYSALMLLGLQREPGCSDTPRELIWIQYINLSLEKYIRT
ncbi:MAG TPA: hypothetical protein PK957_03900 [Candidatus Dojkabacteria bacterium]|nr:hypothetical protein [Candidatus Dojkabacteria bacterium]HQF36757.1 hypothetical protein [Candidatus Dojkabacteria bacterium]